MINNFNAWDWVVPHDSNPFQLKNIYQTNFVPQSECASQFEQKQKATDAAHGLQREV